LLLESLGTIAFTFEGGGQVVEFLLARLPKIEKRLKYVGYEIGISLALREYIVCTYLQTFDALLEFLVLGLSLSQLCQQRLEHYVILAGSRLAFARARLKNMHC